MKLFYFYDFGIGEFVQGRSISHYSSLASSIMKSIVKPSSRSRFPVKLICCIAFGSALSGCFLLKSVANILWCLLK